MPNAIAKAVTGSLLARSVGVVIHIPRHVLRAGELFARLT